MITIRGTQNLQDVLWDLNIIGVSPVEDLPNINLANTFAPQKVEAVTRRLSRLLRWTGTRTMQFSTGAWDLAKQVLQHTVQCVDEQHVSAAALAQDYSHRPQSRWRCGLPCSTCVVLCVEYGRTRRGCRDSQDSVRHVCAATGAGRPEDR